MHVTAFLNRAGLIKTFPHGDFENMEAILAKYSRKYHNVLVAIEGFYRSVPSHCARGRR